MFTKESTSTVTWTSRILAAILPLVLGVASAPLRAEAPAGFKVELVVKDHVSELTFSSAPSMAKEAVITGENAGTVLPNDQTTTVRWDQTQGNVTARVWRVDTNKTTGLPTVGDECFPPTSTKANELPIDLSTLNCPGRLKGGAIIQLRRSTSDTKYANLYIPNRKLAVHGSDMGIAMTLIDRWKEDDRKSFRLTTGANFYYAIAKGGSEHFRPIASVNLLDFDDKQDFELGFGLGFLTTLTALKSGEKDLGLVYGVGYNLMVDDHSKAWYSFVGFSINFQQK